MLVKVKLQPRKNRLKPLKQVRVKRAVLLRKVRLQNGFKVRGYQPPQPDVPVHVPVQPHKQRVKVLIWPQPVLLAQPEVPLFPDVQPHLPKLERQHAVPQVPLHLKKRRAHPKRLRNNIVQVEPLKQQRPRVPHRTRRTHVP